MNIDVFFDDDTFTFTYVVSCPNTSQAAVIDPVLNFDPYTGKTSTHSIDKVEAYINDNHLSLEYILETHVHADHLTGAKKLKERLGGTIAIGEHIEKVIKHWAPIFNHPVSKHQFDKLLKDNEVFNIGELNVKVLHTPGHTPACISYYIQDAVFTGDTIFMPHLGTARADFPGGSAETLYDSIHKLYALSDNTRLFVCHDYPQSGDKPKYMTTVKAQKETNIMLDASISKTEFVEKRHARDVTLAAPKLLLPSIQVNMHAGHLPAAESNGIQYIKIPLNQL